MSDVLDPRARELLDGIEAVGSLPALAGACEAHAQETLFRLAFEVAHACWKLSTKTQAGVEPEIVAARFEAAEAFLAGEEVDPSGLARFVPLPEGTPAEREWLSWNSHVVQPLGCLLGALRTGNRHAANLAIADAARWVSEEHLLEAVVPRITAWISEAR